MMMKVSVYTRNRNCENYPFGLASAVHFSAQMEGETVMMNRNYGILFAQGEISRNNTIIPLPMNQERNTDSDMAKKLVEVYR